jgi:DNA repair exonuclease SbcCD nuclease subunit
MDNLFNKAVVFTDSHFGRESNSPVANQDNLAFIDWMLDRARSWGAETCLFLGDWFHDRAAVGVTTLHAALVGLEKLSQSGLNQVVFILGNHDLARRQGRDIASVNFCRHLPNITLITDPLVVDGVVFLPWLLEDELHSVSQYQGRYVFGHLETIGAMMNSQVACTGGVHAIEASSFAHHDSVFLGHFHKRQALKNLHYIGSVMPFDFRDAGDTERGAMFLQWGKQPFFESWPEQPLYKALNLSAVLDQSAWLKPNTTLRLTVDIPMKYEESEEIRDHLMQLYGLRKIELRNLKPLMTALSEPIEQKGIEQIFIEGLQKIETVGLSTERLISLYQRL